MVIYKIARPCPNPAKENERKTEPRYLWKILGLDCSVPHLIENEGMWYVASVSSMRIEIGLALPRSCGSRHATHSRSLRTDLSRIFKTGSRTKVKRPAKQRSLRTCCQRLIRNNVSSDRRGSFLSFSIFRCSLFSSSSASSRAFKACKQ